MSSIKGPLRECRSIRSCASGLPYYCAPLVCIPAVIGLLAVWSHNKPKPKPKRFLVIREIGIGNLFSPRTYASPKALWNVLPTCRGLAGDLQGWPKKFGRLWSSSPGQLPGSYVVVRFVLVYSWIYSWPSAFTSRRDTTFERSFPDMHPATNSFSWQKCHFQTPSTFRDFIDIPAKRLRFPRIVLLPGKEPCRGCVLLGWLHTQPSRYKMSALH